MPTPRTAFVKGARRRSGFPRVASRPALGCASLFSRDRLRFLATLAVSMDRVELDRGLPDLQFPPKGQRFTLPGPVQPALGFRHGLDGKRPSLRFRMGSDLQMSKERELGREEISWIAQCETPGVGDAQGAAAGESHSLGELGFAGVLVGEGTGDLDDIFGRLDAKAARRTGPRSHRPKVSRRVLIVT